MTGWQKDLERMRLSPGGWRYAQVARILERHGFEVRGPKGTSHRTWVHPAGILVTIVDRGARPMKPVYVRKALEAIDRIEEERS